MSDTKPTSTYRGTSTRVPLSQKGQRNRREQMVKAGIPPTVPSEVLRARILALFELGWTADAIAKHAGLAYRTVNVLAKGERNHCHFRTAQAIMSIPVCRPAKRADIVVGKVSALGAKRRIRALNRMGHSALDIEAVAGIPRTSVDQIMRRDSIMAHRHHDIVRAYEQMSTSRGTCGAAATRAFKGGWPDPFDWESADIDDPSSFPEVVERRPEKNRDEVRKTALKLIRKGVRRQEVADRLGMSRRTIDRWAVEAKRRTREVHEEGSAA